MGYSLWGCKELDMTERLSMPSEKSNPKKEEGRDTESKTELLH